jgi:hypothetical protein
VADALGAALSDGVADGSGGPEISVGVGTGGRLSGGNGETGDDEGGTDGVADGTTAMTELDAADGDRVGTIAVEDADGPADGVAYRT